MTWEEKQAALAWLQDAADPAAGVPEAKTLLAMVEESDAQHNTVLGMCMARRPHAEIRDYILAANS